MKVAEEFVIAQPPQTLWAFFEQFDQVAQCVPGVEDVTVIDDDNSRVRLTQSLGPMTATFDVKMRVTERDPGRSLAFTAVGRSVRGAAGNVRANHVVRLSDEGSGSTRVLLEGDVALGGMLGSVGQKVVAKQAAVVTQSFAQALQHRLGGGTMAAVENGDEKASFGAGDPAEQASAGGGGGDPAEQASAGAPTAEGNTAADSPAAQASPASGAGAPAAGTPPPPPLPGGSGARNKIVRVVMAGAVVLALLEAIRRLRSR